MRVLFRKKSAFEWILWLTGIAAVLVNTYFLFAESGIPRWVRLVSIYGYLVIGSLILFNYFKSVGKK